MLIASFFHGPTAAVWAINTHVIDVIDPDVPMSSSAATVRAADYPRSGSRPWPEPSATSNAAARCPSIPGFEDHEGRRMTTCLSVVFRSFAMTLLLHGHDIIMICETMKGVLTAIASLVRS